MSEDGGTIPGLVDLRVDAVYERAREPSMMIRYPTCWV